MTACCDGDHVTRLLERCEIRADLPADLGEHGGSKHASASFDEATASGFAAIELAAQGMDVRRIDHEEIVSMAAGEKAGM
jgi:hypothetical protein